MATSLLRAGTAFCGLLVMITACTPPPDVVPGVSRELARERKARLSDIRYTLEFRIPADPAADIGASAGIDFVDADPGSALQLDFREDPASILAVAVNGSPVEADVRNEHLVIAPGSLEPGANRIDIRFVAGSDSLNRNPGYLYTLFVPDRARTAFPLFDQPDLKARFLLTLEIPTGWTAMSNAPADSVETLAPGTRIRFAESDLIPSYLFSFVAGDFQTVTREVGGRRMTMLHRETDADKVARNVDEIFALHARALDWLEDYTGIDYPYQKFGFVLIPAFQYGGMEHVGAIQYRASSLMLDEAPSPSRLLGRAALIAHETAHMWFGDLVTMAWFDDVWTKEVFANFMAAKIVNPSFPDIDHELNFLVSHYPSAYSVDRTAGANPIRQPLDNLNEAGQLYGAIIYDKAPVMMRQLEWRIGADAFRDGLREYLRRFAFGNATWPDLIGILDAGSDADLAAWSDVWVNTPGRPEFGIDDSGAGPVLVQADPAGEGRSWPQRFGVTWRDDDGIVTTEVRSGADAVPLPGPASAGDEIVDGDGRGYGLFPATPASLDWLPADDALGRAALVVNLYENLLERGRPAPAAWFDRLLDRVQREDDPLVLELALGQLRRIYWLLLDDDEFAARSAGVEEALWNAMLASADSARRKVWFEAFADVAVNADAIARTRAVWSGALDVGGLPLSEDDRIELAMTLAIKLPDDADDILKVQRAATENPDNLRRLDYLAPSLSADPAVRDRFFASLGDEDMRTTESWVLEALDNLHHPLRRAESERYILPSLELLQEIQVTGDIFFPKRWLDATLANHRSAAAVDTVRNFLADRPDYNAQLRMKILQSADMMFRARRLTDPDRPATPTP